MAERARVVRKIAVASRRAKLARQFNPRTSIPKFKVEMGQASRTPKLSKIPSMRPEQNLLLFSTKVHHHALVFLILEEKELLYIVRSELKI